MPSNLAELVLVEMRVVVIFVSWISKRVQFGVRQNVRDRGSSHVLAFLGSATLNSFLFLRDKS